MPHNLEVVDAVEQRLQAGGEHRMIFDQHDAPTLGAADGRGAHRTGGKRSACPLSYRMQAHTHSSPHLLLTYHPGSLLERRRRCHVSRRSIHSFPRTWPSTCVCTTSAVCPATGPTPPRR